MSAGDVTLTDAERERLWDVISRIRDAAPRRPDDASTDDIIDGIIDSGWVYDVLAARTPTATGDDLRDRVAALAEASERDGRGGVWVHDAWFTTVLAASSAPVVSRPEAVDGLDGFEYTLTRRALMQIKAEAWDEGAKKASPYGGGYLRSLYAENPYRAVSPASDSAAP